MTTTQTTQDSNYELIDLGNGQTIELESDGNLIAIHANDEESATSVGLTIAEAEALIAKLAVKVAQARMAA
jgi:hypothetical protein